MDKQKYERAVSLISNIELASDSVSSMEAFIELMRDTKRKEDIGRIGIDIRLIPKGERPIFFGLTVSGKQTKDFIGIMIEVAKRILPELQADKEKLEKELSEL